MGGSTDATATQRVVTRLARAAQKAVASGHHYSAVTVSTPEERQRERVCTVATTAPLNVSHLARVFPGANIYVRGDLAASGAALDVYFDPRTVDGPPAHRVHPFAVLSAWLAAYVAWTLAV
jgi:hypothetical protein